MLRVSSYRRLFEEDQWIGAGGISRRCAEQYRSSARSVSRVPCVPLVFVSRVVIKDVSLHLGEKNQAIKSYVIKIIQYINQMSNVKNAFK